MEDIAHALSHQCRFGGHLPRFYSVAQHSILVSVIVPDEHKLAALLHDASEAYLLDIPRPIKLKLSNYAEIENNLMTMIADMFGFDWPLHESVKHADEVLLQKEWKEIMLRGQDEEFECFSSTHAKQNFLNRFKNLTNDKATVL